MIGTSRVLAIIPARGGSKGVPRKNIREVGGKPLLAWTVEAARASQYLDRTILSSDDEEIMRTAESVGCDVPFRRPAEFATDEADALSVIQHAIGALDEIYEYVVWLQPTSPLRRGTDIDNAIALCVERKAPSCVGVVETEKSPFWSMTMTGDGTLVPLMGADQMPSRRQDAPVTYALNGAVYVARAADLAAGQSFFVPGTVGYVMPRERSFDIDSELDLQIVDFLIKQNRK